VTRAQERGEVAKQGGARNFKIPKENFETTTADIGLTLKQVHEARAVRDAEHLIWNFANSIFAKGPGPSKGVRQNSFVCMYLRERRRVVNYSNHYVFGRPRALRPRRVARFEFC
jgi:hypothetical protein